jgi:hypothetical protein
VIVDAEAVDKVISIRDLVEPRGMTPLYDAAALLLDRAEAHRGDPDDQFVVIFTDGLENASQQWTHKRLFARINGLDVCVPRSEPGQLRHRRTTRDASRQRQQLPR